MIFRQAWSTMNGKGFVRLRKGMDVELVDRVLTRLSPGVVVCLRSRNGVKACCNGNCVDPKCKRTNPNK